SEGSDPSSTDVVAPTINKRTLTMRDAALYFDVTFEMIRRNIAGSGLNNQLNQLFSKRFGKDLVRVIFNGDRDKANDTRLNKCLRVADGIIKRATADANVHDYSINGSEDYIGTILPGMLKLLPKDYRDNRDELAFFVSADVEDAIADQIGARKTAYADMVLFGDEKFYKYKRITIFPVYGLPDGSPILTPKKNIVVGFGEQATIGHDIYNRKRVDEVTLSVDFDVNYAVGDAIVMGA
ncbi:MAG: hypothetical protein J7L22_00290, partial [Candidatus Marinimicrobia bacterium]|nr:hypothetical protein [Candidatus Neomarinimicrobiota bacterium]